MKGRLGFWSVESRWRSSADAEEAQIKEGPPAAEVWPEKPAKARLAAARRARCRGARARRRWGGR